MSISRHPTPALHLRAIWDLLNTSGWFPLKIHRRFRCSAERLSVLMPESGRGRSVRQDQREHRPEIPALAAGPVVELDFQERSGGVIEAHQTEIEGGEPWTLPRRRADDNARDPVHPRWVGKPLRFTIPEASQPRGDSPIGGA